MIQIFRRSFLAGSAAVLAAATVMRGTVQSAVAEQALDLGALLTYPFVVPTLPYAYTANGPSIDELTMHLHHDKHHLTYVTNLNTALKDHADLHAVPLRDLLGRVPNLPESIRTVVQNNAGGHANQTMFWQVMGGRGGTPTGPIGEAIARDFGSFDALKARFGKTGVSVFGSGWAMVLTDKAGKLTLVSRQNQDSPLMDGQQPLFGNDVWEHAYYLKYQNRRADYLAAWWKILDWDRINARYAAARAGTLAV